MDVSLHEHTGYIHSIAMSRDGKRILSGSADHTIRAWEGMTSRTLGAPLRGHTGVVSSVVISLDGNMIVSGSYDQTNRAWDVMTRKALGAPLKRYTDIVHSVAILPDGTRIISGSECAEIRVERMTGEILDVPLNGHTSGILFVAFSSDGNLVAWVQGDMTIRVWGAITRRALGASPRTQSTSADGKCIVSGSSDKTVQVWDLEFVTQSRLFEVYVSHPIRLMLFLPPPFCKTFRL